AAWQDDGVATKTAHRDLGTLAEELRVTGLRVGLAAVGVASAEPFMTTRAVLTERKAAALHGGMHFTYGDPARSTDPGRALDGARSLVVGAMSYLCEDVERP